jgi:hypothetical protein
MQLQCQTRGVSAQSAGRAVRPVPFASAPKSLRKQPVRAPQVVRAAEGEHTISFCRLPGCSPAHPGPSLSSASQFAEPQDRHHTWQHARSTQICTVQSHIPYLHRQYTHPDVLMVHACSR